MNAMVLEKDSNGPIPGNVLAEAEKITRIRNSRGKSRKREHARREHFYIDPSTKKTSTARPIVPSAGRRHYEIGVHIAEFLFYVCPDSALDDEAKMRTTSVYLVDPS